MFRGKGVSLFPCLLILLFNATAMAQSNFGSLRGQITGAGGAAVPNATVKVTDAGTGAAVTVTTNAEGQYAAPSLRPVAYNVAVEARGFKRAVVSAVKVDTAQDVTLNVTLETGELSDSVNITSDAPLLQTESSAVTRTVDQRTINDIPLNGRNTLELALILPGAAGSAGSELTSANQTDVLPGRELIINGGRPGSTQFYADGANVTSVALARTTVSFTPDTIQEFSVQQSNYSAQYSQAGGAIIQQTTKSGTNEFHGTVYW
ncbi:MAG: carboxypeptidase regulatory-like domain-containing protein, partial [Blastocatellia bacterium]